MSIPFRLKYALGLIPTADSLDAKWEKLIKMREDLNKMENSEELKQFEDLKNLIGSSAFQHKKREIESLNFVGSEEEKLIQEHKTLLKSGAIKNYQKLSGSDRLMRLQNILTCSSLKKYIELQKEVESFEFSKRKSELKKKEFLKTTDYQIYKEYYQLKRSSDMTFWRKFSQSESYLSYLKTAESKELKRLGELNKLTSAPEFVDRVSYLKDKRRFQKSEEFKRILSFNELDKSKFMFEYRKLKKAKELDFFEKWEIIFEEDFSDKQLNTERWQPENWWGHRMAGTSFSQIDELQAYNGIKNIELNNKTLSIWTKKEKFKGTTWNPSVGLLPRQYDYTSSILNSAGFFRINNGVVEAKVRFKKDATITSAFSLTGENGVGLGLVEKQSEGPSKYARIGGLNDQTYHIFRLEMINNQLVWKINGVEVFSNSYRLKEPLFFNLLTSLHGAVNDHLLPHRYEIDWIRCFSQKS
jgi:DNA-binding MltR family transcriptional regulator